MSGHVLLATASLAFSPFLPPSDLFLYPFQSVANIRVVAVATGLHLPRLGSVLPPERQCGVIDPCRSVNTYCLLVVPEASGQTRAGEVL